MHDDRRKERGLHHNFCGGFSVHYDRRETTMDGSNGDAAAGGPNPAGGDGPGQGGVALLSDPVDVIIDKLLR